MKRSLIIFILALSVVSSVYALAQKPLYDTTGYLDKNRQNETFFVPMKILYEDMLLPNGPNHIDTLFLTKYAKTLPASKIPYILDIEAWKIGPDVSDKTANMHIDKYILVIATMKKARPDLKFGYFGVLPVMDIIRPRLPTKQEISQWHHANVHVSRLAPYVDVVTPTPYTFYNDLALWKHFASYQIQEAKMYGKPILSFLWPEFMDCTPFKGQFLPSKLWEEELMLAYEQGDGVIIWGGQNFITHQPRVWDEKAPWWIITKNFIFRHDKEAEERYHQQAAQPPVQHKKVDGYYKPYIWTK